MLVNGDCNYCGFPGGAVVKNPPVNAGDEGEEALIPGQGRSPGEGNSNPLQYSCLENPMDRGAWRATWGHREPDMTERTYMHHHTPPLSLCKRR